MAIMIFHGELVLQICHDGNHSFKPFSFMLAQGLGVLVMLSPNGGGKQQNMTKL